MCSGPFRGTSRTQQLARLHRKGPHRLEAWRSGPLQHQPLRKERMPEILQNFMTDIFTRGQPVPSNGNDDGYNSDGCQCLPTQETEDYWLALMASQMAAGQPSTDQDVSSLSDLSYVQFEGPVSPVRPNHNQ